MEFAAPADDVIVSEATYWATYRKLAYDEFEPVQAKGKSQPLRAFIARREQVVATDLAPARMAPLAGLAGGAG